LSARPSPLRAVVFDLDGTLIDSRRDIAEAANYALERAGFARLSHDELSSYVGDGATALMACAARLDINDGRTAALVASFLDYYADHAIDFTQPMPGALAALDALSGYGLGICTNKPRRTMLAVLRGLQLEPRFGSLVAGDDLEQRKPHPAMVLESARLLGVSADSVVMVGDGPQDVLAGKAAGAFTIGVHGGIIDAERLLRAEPHMMLGSLHELPAALSELARDKPR